MENTISTSILRRSMALAVAVAAFTSVAQPAHAAVTLTITSLQPASGSTYYPGNVPMHGETEVVATEYDYTITSYIACYDENGNKVAFGDATPDLTAIPVAAGVTVTLPASCSADLSLGGYSVRFHTYAFHKVHPEDTISKADTPVEKTNGFTVIKKYLARDEKPVPLNPKPGPVFE